MLGASGDAGQTGILPSLDEVVQSPGGIQEDDSVHNLASTWEPVSFMDSSPAQPASPAASGRDISPEANYDDYSPPSSIGSSQCSTPNSAPVPLSAQPLSEYHIRVLDSITNDSSVTRPPIWQRPKNEERAMRRHKREEHIAARIRKHVEDEAVRRRKDEEDAVVRLRSRMSAERLQSVELSALIGR